MLKKPLVTLSLPILNSMDFYIFNKCIYIFNLFNIPVISF